MTLRPVCTQDLRPVCTPTTFYRSDYTHQMPVLYQQHFQNMVQEEPSAWHCTMPDCVNIQTDMVQIRPSMMIMSFICSCRNKKEEPSSIYTLRKVRTIRGSLEGLVLMI